MDPHAPEVEPHGLGQVAKTAPNPAYYTYPYARSLVNHWGWVRTSASVLLRMGLAPKWPEETPWLKWDSSSGAAVVDPYAPEGREILAAVGRLNAHANPAYGRTKFYDIHEWLLGVLWDPTDD